MNAGKVNGRVNAKKDRHKAKGATSYALAQTKHEKTGAGRGVLVTRFK